MVLPPMVVAQEDDFKILSATDRQLVFEWTPLNWHLREVELPQGNFHSFTFHRFSPIGESGYPEIPQRVVSVAVPNGASVMGEVIEASYEAHSDISLLPVPALEKQEGIFGQLYVPNDSLYRSNEWFPESIWRAEDPALFRSQRVVRLSLSPVQFLPAQKVVRQYTKMIIRLTFSGGVQNSNASRLVSQRDEDLYRNAILNYQQGRSWRLMESPVLRKAAQHQMSGGNWYKIIVSSDGKVISSTGNREGIYKIDANALRKAGLPLSTIDPRTIQIFNNGGRELPEKVTSPKPDSLIENAIIMVGGSDGKFDDSDYILFYGRPVEGVTFDPVKRQYQHYINRYTKENVYWLTFGEKTGRRIPKYDAVPFPGIPEEASYRDLVFFEEEKNNIFNSGVEWFGAELAADKKSYAFNISLPGAVPKDSANFRFSMAVTTRGTHQFNFSANGFSLGSATQSVNPLFYNVKTSAFTASGVLVDGNNSIQINYQPRADISFAYVDWIELEYNRQFRAVNDQLIFNSPLRNATIHYKVTGFGRDDIKVYDITDFSSVKEVGNVVISNGTLSFADVANNVTPKRYLALTAAAYKVPGSISSTPITMAELRKPRVADYIIITHDDFYQPALELESLRENWNSQDRLATEVVKVSDVMNEFGFGLIDPAAIRNFLAWARANWGNPRYVLLLGDGHFDYKNLKGFNTPNLIIPYESNSNYEYTTRTSDDWFTYSLGEDAGMQMAIGRITVRTVDEAQGVVRKIVNYETKPDLGEWRKTVTIVGDDELVVGGSGNETFHTQQAEYLAENYVPKNLNIRKIYLMDYPPVRTASVSGVTKPMATEALIYQINRGTLLLNFIGHGNDELWTHERVLNGPTDFERIQNGDRTAFWVAATCEFAHWDQPDNQSLAEKILAVAGRGAIGLVSSARLAFAHSNAAFNYSFYDELFKDYLTIGLTKRVGDAVVLAKRSVADRTNSEKYGVFGDPAMRLGVPRYRASIDLIQPDTIQALRKMKIKGHVEKEGLIWSDFNGKVLVRVNDSRKIKTYQTSEGSKINYWLEGNSIFRGVVSTTGGFFDLDFIVPKDISYGGNDGRISVYLWNDESDGAGVQGNLSVGGTAVNLVDRDGPSLRVHFGNPEFNPGDYVSPNPVLHVEIADSMSGINTAGDIGHQIVLTLNNDFTASKDVTDYFEYNEGSYTAGVVKYPLYNLAEGAYTLHLKAWDNSNNSSTIESQFVVLADTELQLRNVLTYPNPMIGTCAFTYELSQDADVAVKIYSVNGRLIRKFEKFQSQIGFNVFPERWDGTDQDGDQVANGVYLYKIFATGNRNGQNISMEKIGKLIIAR